MIKQRVFSKIPAFYTHSYQRELIPFLYVYLQITTNPVFAHCDISIAIRPKKLQSCRQQQENEKLLQFCLFLSYFSDVSKAFDIVAAILSRSLLCLNRIAYVLHCLL